MIYANKVDNNCALSIDECNSFIDFDEFTLNTSHSFIKGDIDFVMHPSFEVMLFLYDNEVY